MVFYSEGQNYWVHLEGLVREILSISSINICYVSSSRNDPGLRLDHPNYKSFEVGDGFARDWFFANIDAGVMVMTMPDLHQYQVKKSRYDVHYIYIQHSLVSLHMVYRPRAFEHYDTVFCAGPHHLKEMRAIQKFHGFPDKNLVEHGYGRLDSILSNSRSPMHSVGESPCPIHILFAPSWGNDGTIESGVALKVIENLLDRGYKVTLRPHPQTLKFSKRQINKINEKFGGHLLFKIEDNVAGEESLHDSDLMISDWSGAALDYALGLKKPVLFIDVPKKVNDPNYLKLNIEPLESKIREEIGIVVSPRCTELPIEDCLRLDVSQVDIGNLVFNTGTSNAVGAQAILDILD